MNKVLVDLGPVYSIIQMADGEITVCHGHAVVLETPCFPAIYFAGLATKHGNEYIPVRNDTGQWKRTMVEAEERALAIYCGVIPTWG